MNRDASVSLVDRHDHDDHEEDNDDDDDDDVSAQQEPPDENPANVGQDIDNVNEIDGDDDNDEESLKERDEDDENENEDEIEESSSDNDDDDDDESSEESLFHATGRFLFLDILTNSRDNAVRSIRLMDELMWKVMQLEQQQERQEQEPKVWTHWVVPVNGIVHEDIREDLLYLMENYSSLHELTFDGEDRRNGEQEGISNNVDIDFMVCLMEAYRNNMDNVAFEHDDDDDSSSSSLVCYTIHPERRISFHCFSHYNVPPTLEKPLSSVDEWLTKITDAMSSRKNNNDNSRSSSSNCSNNYKNVMKVGISNCNALATEIFLEASRRSGYAVNLLDFKVVAATPPENEDASNNNNNNNESSSSSSSSLLLSKNALRNISDSLADGLLRDFTLQGNDDSSDAMANVLKGIAYAWRGTTTTTNNNNNNIKSMTRFRIIGALDEAGMQILGFLIHLIHLSDMRIEKLLLGDVIRSEPAWRILCQRAAVGAVQCLSISCIRPRRQGAAPFLSNDFGDGLREMLLGENSGLDGLKELELRLADLSQVFNLRESLAASKSLLKLHLSFVTLEDAQLCALFEGIQMSNILQDLECHVDCRNNETAVKIAHSLSKTTSLVKLRLGFGDRGHFLHQSLTSMIRSDMISVQGLRISQEIKVADMPVLDLYFDAMRGNSHIKCLTLSFPSVDESALESLPRHLASMKVLEELYVELEFCLELDDTNWWSRLVEAMKDNTCLREIDLNENDYIEFPSLELVQIYAMRNSFKCMVRQHSPSTAVALTPFLLRRTAQLGGLSEMFMGIHEVVNLLPWSLSFSASTKRKACSAE